MDGPVSVVLCGLGGYGGTYLPPLLDPANAGRARLVAGGDPLPERCPQLAAPRARGIPGHASLEDFYRPGAAGRGGLSPPIPLQAPQSARALAHGSHLLVEKPLCATVADGERIATAHAASSRHAGVGFQWSYCEPILRLKRDIARGRFGKP